MQIPFIGDVGTASLALLGISALMGFVIGSGLKQSLKIVIILVAAAIIFLGFKPDAIQNLISIVSTVKPLLSEFQSNFLGANATPAMLIFGVSFVLGMWKG